MCSGAGAVWVWDKSKAQVRTSQLHASSTYVVLTHGDGHADIQASPELLHLPATNAGWAFAGLHLLPRHGCMKCILELTWMAGKVG